MNYLKSKTLISILILTVISFLIYGFANGFFIIIPTNVSWLLAAYHDWGQHYLGWVYYRNSPWEFPLGNTSGYYYPIGTNVGFTDSIPLLSFFFKLFSFILPENFQFFGLFMFINYFLIAYYSFKIFNYYKVNNWIIYVFVIFLVSNPVLVFRGIHPSLTAHWLLIASFYYYIISSDKDKVTFANKMQIVILVLSAWIHPYLSAMLIGFNFIIPLKNYFFDKSIKLTKLFLYPAISIFLLFTSWFIIGYFENGNSSYSGSDLNVYGLYSFNLNAFFDSMGYFSKFLPDLNNVAVQQYEGFAYLGLGVILLLLIDSFHFLKLYFTKKKSTISFDKYFYLFIIIFVLSLFAISNKISFGDNILIEIPIPNIIKKVGVTFRAIGRFIWPFYYFLLIFSLVYFAKIKWKKSIKITILVLLLIIQIFDISPLILTRTHENKPFTTKYLDEKKWDNLISQFDAIITYPPFETNLISQSDYQDFLYIGSKYNIPVSTGYVARNYPEIDNKFVDSLRQNIINNSLNKNFLYITTAKYLDDFGTPISKKSVNILQLDDYIIIYDKNKKLKNVDHTIKDDLKENLHRIENQMLIHKSKLILFKENIILFNVEDKTTKTNYIIVKGWAFIKETKNNASDSIFLTLSNDKNTYYKSMTNTRRTDVSIHFNIGNLDNSGFSGIFSLDEIPAGIYNLGLLIKTNNKIEHVLIDKNIEPGKKSYPKKFNKNTTLGDVFFNVEEIINHDGEIKIKGWAFLDKIESKKTKTYLLFKSIDYTYFIETKQQNREDVTNYFRNIYNYDLSGFETNFHFSTLPKGNYQVGIIINYNNINYLKMTEKKVMI